MRPPKAVFILILFMGIVTGLTACRVLIEKFDGTIDPQRIPPIPLQGP